jgi:SSS family solute:Na+ symporter
MTARPSGRTLAQQAQMAKIVSLVVKFGALVFIVFIPLSYAIDLQLLGGIWMIQTLPAVFIALYTRWFHDRALLIGWTVGIIAGTWMFFAATPAPGPVYPIALFGWIFPCYTAFATVILNLVVAAILTPIFNAMSAPGRDETRAEHYV